MVDTKLVKKKLYIAAFLCTVTLLVVPTLRNSLHNWRYQQIYVESVGQGPPVVMLHGLSGNHAYWAPLVDALSSEHEVITPDLLGFGLSPWPASGYTFESYIEQLSPILPNKPFVLVGHSLGSLIALEYASRYPEKVSQLILLGPPSIESRSELKQILSRQSRVESIMSLDSLWAPLACHIHEALGPLSYYLIRPFVDQVLPDEVVRAVTLHRWESYNDNLENIILRYQALNHFQDVDRDKLHVLLGEDDGYSKNEHWESAPVDVQLFPGGHNFLWASTEQVVLHVQNILSLK